MDKITPARRSENMRQIRHKDMKPELAVRQLVHSMGYRYRLHRKDLPGKPDLVFCPKKKIIFVHGCFWHAHEQQGCRDSRKPKSNMGYWSPKLQGNKERDARHVARLRDLGWDVLTIWECEVDEPSLARRIRFFLERSRP
jgi:DNA mismatch endonuclease (patch repair protein)